MNSPKRRPQGVYTAGATASAPPSTAKLLDSIITAQRSPLHRRRASGSYAAMDDYILSPVEPLRVERSRTAGPKAPLRLLSLDGGGVRGFSCILLIQELMLKLFVELEGRAPRTGEIPKPCEHFDLIGGTGTGGLIAIMLGRLRMDLETCKAVYIRTSKKVFETDKTVAGIPYRKTLFKASMLEEAIKDVVREMTVGVERETISMYLDSKNVPHPGSFTDSGSDGSFSPALSQNSIGSRPRWGPGNENAPMHDDRRHRCRTFVTAVYKGSDDSVGPAILRSYDSSASTAPSQDCTIWEAGRATCAHFPAFKQIQIGQDIFLDEGPGRYSPVAQVLEEAIVHEWPGREVGVIISIGGGKRATATYSTPESPKRERSRSVLHHTPLGKFAEAREKHMQKMDDCEAIHQEVLAGLHRTGVAQHNYFRLNIEIGQDAESQFGINEWSRMADISTTTKKYLTRQDVQVMNRTVAEKMAQIHRQNWELASNGSYTPQILNRELPSLPAEAQSPGMTSYHSGRSYASFRNPSLATGGSDSEDEEVTQHLHQLEEIQKHMQV